MWLGRYSTMLKWEFSAGVCTWFERVASHSHVADAPSRGDLSMLDVKCQIDVNLIEIVQNILEGTGMAVSWGVCTSQTANSPRVCKKGFCISSSGMRH